MTQYIWTAYWRASAPSLNTCYTVSVMSIDSSISLRQQDAALFYPIDIGESLRSRGEPRRMHPNSKSPTSLLALSLLQRPGVSSDVWMTCNTVGDMVKGMKQNLVNNHTCYLRTEEIGLKIVTTTKISNKFLRESTHISNTFSGESPLFSMSFHLSKRSTCHSKDLPGNRVAWDLEIQIF